MKQKSRTHTQSATTAALIKKILKKGYPHIKFSVCSDNFANGDSVDVSWTDGIPTSTVEKNIYKNISKLTQFVHAQRHISESIRLQAEEDLCELAGKELKIEAAKTGKSMRQIVIDAIKNRPVTMRYITLAKKI